MSIDLSKATALSDQYGNIVQLELGGMVIWAAQTGNEPAVILDVAKQTATTYAGETAYTNEEFILLDIYPKKGGAVKVTYGGLTKTIKDTSGAEEPNAIQVFFGTFNGVSDSVTTPASGRLTIEGAYRGYAVGTFGGYSGKSSGTYCSCITSVVDFGNPVIIPNYAFYKCANVALTSLPSGITSIGAYAFYGCTSLTLASLPSSITSIGNYAFYGCTSLTLASLPSGVTSIGNYTFYKCTSLRKVPTHSGVTSIGENAFEGCSGLTSIELAEGVVSIGNYAFRLCEESAATSIPMYNGSVVIPDTVQSIGIQAFSVKSSNSAAINAPAYLGTVRFLSATPPRFTEIDDYSFETCFGLCGGKGTRTLIAPAGCYQVYLNELKYPYQNAFSTNYWSVVEAS